MQNSFKLQRTCIFFSQMMTESHHARSKKIGYAILHSLTLEYKGNKANRVRLYVKSVIVFGIQWND